MDMKIDPAGAVSLAAVIRKDLASIATIEQHAASLPVSRLNRSELDSLGFALHNLYNALENSFTQISLTFENHVRDQSRWHRELMDKMFLDLGQLRPAVLTGASRGLLTDLLGFRHLFRHAYDFSLDEPRTVALWQRWQADSPALRVALTRFAEALDVIALQLGHARDET